MQSLHVYDYFCYRKWNLEGNFEHDSLKAAAQKYFSGHSSLFLTECQSPKMMMQSRSVLGRGFTMNLDRTSKEIGRTMTIVSHERGHWLPGRPYDKGTALL